jgi:hypothetical protein
MSSNPYSALDETGDNVSKKTAPKVQPTTTTTPVVKKEEVKKVEKKVDAPQDGFEQVSKVGRGGRPQRGTSDRGTRGSTRGPSTRGFSRGGRGGSRPPRTDSNDLNSTEEGVKEPRKERTGPPKEGTRGRGRFHDHHLSGTGTRGGFKKRGGGGHNWGTIKDEVEASTTEGEVSLAEKTDVPQEEKVVEVVDPKTLSENQKKALRKKRKDDEKKERKNLGKKSEEKVADELTVDQVKVVKTDPNQKSLAEYQKELDEKKKSTLVKIGKAPEEKKETKVVATEKKDDKKSPLDVNDLFKGGKKSSGNKKEEAPKKGGKTPKVTDQKDFPQLK